MEFMSLAYIHYTLGYSLFGLVLLELAWSLVETVTDLGQGNLSSIKSSVIVGLIDLQVLLGILNLSVYGYYLGRVLVHAITMLIAVVVLHIGNNTTGLTRVGLQAAGLICVLVGIGFLHML